MYKNEKTNSFDSDFQNKNMRLFLYSKRIFDVLISVVLLPVIMVIIFVTGLAIILDSKGPVFYSQKRVGKNGISFKIYKLRSMKVNAEEYSGSVWAEKNDPRVTRVGKFIRKVRIDELPQFINILKGDMSLIGPRPERDDLTEKFTSINPNFVKRLSVKPGITGLAQINGGYDISPDEKLKFDIEYIENLSVINEIKILIGTVKVILTGHGAR